MSDSFIDDETLLNIVIQSFEEARGIKILSIQQSDNIIYGVYIVPPNQTLSFLQMPSYNIETDLMGKDIIMIELGQILYDTYRVGNIFLYDILTTPSEIKIVSNLFDTLVSKCLKNPPLLQVNNILIDLLFGDENITKQDVEMFCKVFDIYKKMDDSIKVNTNISMEANTKTQIVNEFSSARSQLKSMKPKKNTEAFMNEIDKLYIQLQINLYMTETL